MAKERVQVQGLGDVAPGIQPTIQRAGQYGIQVQRAGRNKLMDLADALGQINPVLQQYGALQKQQEQIGIEEAKLVEEQNVIAELKKQKDVDGFSLLATTNRDRAYRDALLKRHINSTMLPSINAKADDLINAETYRTQADHGKAVDDMLSAEWDNLVGQVGEGVANSTAGKALWSIVTTPYKNELALKYEKARDEVILNNSTQELGLQLSAATKPIVDPATGRVIPLDTSNLQTIAENTEARLSEDLPQLSNTDRNKVLVSAYATEVDNLFAQQRYTDASRMLAVLKATKINGVPVFNTTQAKSVLNPIEAKLNNKLLSLDEKRDTKVGKRFANRVVSVLGNIKNIEERDQLSDITAEEIKDSFVSLNPNLTAEQLDAEVENLFNGTASPIQLFMQRIREVANSSGDEGEFLYYENVDDIRDGYEAALQFPFDPVPLTKENREGIVKEYEQYHKKENKDALAFIKEKYDNRIKISQIPELKAKSNELMAGEYIKDRPVYTGIEDRLKSNLKVIDQRYEDNDFELDYGNFLERAYPVIQSALEKKAKELAGPAYDDTRDEILQRLADDLLSQETERYEGIIKAKEISFGIEAITEKQKEQLKPSKEAGVLRGKGEIIYASLDETKTRKKQSKYKAGRLVATTYTSGNIDRELINSDRKLMIENRATNDLKLSLVRYGFDGYSPESAAILEKAYLDFMDVKLFGNDQEFRNLVGRWSPVLDKDLRNLELTEEEKEIRDEFQSFGVFDDKTMLQFSSSQETFLND
jgi:hypothetical protein